jgi:AmmeMemoRadiSam system protein B
MWLLRDPLRLTERQLVVPQALGPLLMFFNGNHTAEEIHQLFCQQVGEDVPIEIVENVLDQLDSAYLLENDRSRQAQQRELLKYRAQPFRPPALAGISYPEEPAEVTALFDSYAATDELDGWQPWAGRALISPHIDYERGGPVYARVWRRARAAIAAADLVLIFGTDHNGGTGTVTLTQQPYATPFGVLPTAPDLVEALAEALEPEEAYALELNHREEHSVELSAVWLHYLYRELERDPVPVVPILCGSFQHFVGNGNHPAGEERLSRFITTLQQETAGKKVLAVASVDFAHAGPAFGDPFPMNAPRRQQLAESDRSLIEAITQGDHRRFYQEIADVNDRYRICGFSSTYLMLRYLDGTQGVEVAYEHCPADERDSSLVSICGLLLE